MALSFVYFDIGDTLLHKPQLIPMLTEVLARHGHDIPLDVARRTHKTLTESQHFPPTTNRGFYLRFNTLLLETLGICPNEALAEEIYLALKNRPWEAVAGVDKLSLIKLPVGVLSNWDSSLNGKLEELIPLDFEFVLGSEDAGFAKPDVEFFRQAIERAAVPPNEIAMVGDSMHLDISPARLLGMHTILHDPYDFYPHHRGNRVRSIAEVPSLLRSIG